jgi:outer membrane protein OmpA-like peptidoglycan-associated protein
MRTSTIQTALLGALLISGGLVSAHAADGLFYDPSNAASPTGKTIGHELYRTIGCPGRELSATPCPYTEPVAAVAPAPAPVAVAATPAPTPVVAAVAPTPVAAAPPRKKLVLEGVHFEFDKDTLRPEDIAEIDRNVVGLDQWGKINIEVAGHTDSRGSDAYNLDLSQRRAETIRDYLVSKGIEAERLVAKGYGETQPVADNASDEGRFSNRRVELVPVE